MSTELNHAIIRVPLGARTYDVRIGHGLIEQAGARLQERLGLRRAIVLADAALEATPHLDRLRRTVAATVITVAPGEASKSLDAYGRLMEDLLALAPDRRTVIVALGGGVVGDLAGFAAATLLRGVAFVQLPTTLLAQVDSSVGGKTGINSRHGKNLIGAFHQPSLVLADLDTLATLPRRELLAGYAEVVKYGVLGDAGFFDWLEAHGRRALTLDPAALRHMVATSVEAKARIVAEDEHEQNDRRALLNLGHSFAHAFEALTGYGPDLLHGEAVAIGISQAFRLSSRLGLCASEDCRRVEHHLQMVGLPITGAAPSANLAPEAVVEAMYRDKKSVDGRLTLILVRGIGEAFVSHDVDASLVLDHLRQAA